MHDKGFPTLFIPSTTRLPLGFTPLEKTPHSVQDLPARLPMGDLQPQTFRKTAEGFEVCYRSDDFSMTLDLSGDHFSARVSYKGAELLHYMGNARMFLGPRMTQLRIGPSEEADQQIGSDLQGIGNIRYAPFGDVMKVGSSNFFPDGFLMSIVIPLPISSSRFQGLTGFFRSLPDDGSLTLSGFMAFAQHEVNYREGLCSDVPADPMLLYLWSLERGYLPVAMPVLEGQAGNRALTLRRMGYNLVLNVFMRDIFRVVKLLSRAGLIGSTHGTSREETTIIANSYSLLRAKELSFYTDDLSRRVVFPAIMTEDIPMQTTPLGHDAFDHQLNAVVARYQGVVTNFRAQFDQKVAEALSNGR